MAATAQLARLDASRTSSGGHTREHTSVLAAAEKRVLIWIAERLPRWVGSDHLTALGAIAMVLTAVAFAAASVDVRALLTVPLLLAINWFGDSLDGTLARVRNQQRPRYGFYLDHVVDIANTVVLFTGLAFSGLCSPWTAVALMVGYLLLSGEAFLATHTLGVFRLAFSGMGPTELRILLAAGALTAIDHTWVRPFGFGPVRLFDLGGVIGAFGMAVVFLVSATRNARTLYRAEPLPDRERR